VALGPRRLMISLSASQLDVVSHRGSPLQVIACAGSGKTESISRRIAALVAEGVEPGAIVAFTFTDRAATELKARIVRRVAEQLGEVARGRLGPMFVGTIHGYCFRLLQDHVPRFGKYDVLDEHRHVGLLSREYRALGLSKLGAKHWEPLHEFLSHVDVITNELIPAERLDGTPLGECYRAYRAMLDRHSFLTFGLQIALAVEALDDPAIFAKVHGPLRYLLVDEYQDINPAQERLIERLSASPVELCVVGDDDQSIYQWRGADVTNILRFDERHAGTRRVTLATNRRSRAEIVTKANAFAGTIPLRLDKVMEPVRPGGDVEVVPWKAETPEDEAATIAETISRLRERGFRYRDIGVLFRSVRTSAPPLITALRARDIPFTCGGRTGLFLEPDIALLGETYVWLSDGDWRDEKYGETRPADLDRAVLGLSQRFGVDAGPLRKYLTDWKSFLLKTNQPINLVGDLYRLLGVLKADQVDLTTAANSTRFGGLARFSQTLADFEHVTRRGQVAEQEGGRAFHPGLDRGKPYLRALAGYLLHYAKNAYEEFEGEEAVDLDAVDVLTVHQAKGLEWPVVFLPCLVEGRFPSRRAGEGRSWLIGDDVLPARVKTRYEGGDSEERRLFYVAMTRARDTVYLSAFDRKTKKFRPSSYLLEVAGREIPTRSELPAGDAPTEEAPSEPPPVEISFSDLASLDECGHRYRLGTVFGFQQELALELGYGKAIHHVLRHLSERVRETGVIPTGDDLEHILADEFYLPYANVPSFIRMQQAARSLLRLYAERHAAELHRLWATERPFELHLPGAIVTGRADVVLDLEENRPGALALVDYKSANDPRRAERYELQLRVYAAAGRAEGLTIAAAWLHELREGSRHEVDIGDKPVDGAVCLVADRTAAIRARRFDAKPTPEKCSGCQYVRLCAYREGGIPA